MSSSEAIAITGGHIVLADSVVDGTLVLAAGKIAGVSGQGAPAGAQIVDVDGAYVVPGLIDLHNDSLETEINPRPETNLPFEFALGNFERRLVASGVTTEFHAISFMEITRSGRTVRDAYTRAHYVAASASDGSRIIDHHVLHRLDVWNKEGADVLFESLQEHDLRYLSINDHTPGQGQYRDVDKFVERMAAWSESRGGKAPTDSSMRETMATRDADAETVPAVYARIHRAAKELGVIVATHDDDTPEKVDAQWHIGAKVAEFPITVESAQRARERGMTIIVGAPNIVRGGSSSGNQDARELFKLGLADVICADYHAPSLLPAAFRLVDEGLLDLPAAIATVTRNAARAICLADAGEIAPGMRADIAIVRRDAGRTPAVERVYKDGSEVFRLSSARRPAGVSA